MSPTDSRVLQLACLLLATFAVAALVYPLAALPRLPGRDWNEAWNAYWAVAAMHGNTLYPPLVAMISNNYPPLHFYVIGLAGLLTGDVITAGRSIALLAFLTVALNIFLLLRLSSASRATSCLGALLFLCMGCAIAPDMRAMTDPQWLANALITGGAVVLVRRPQNIAWLICAAALMLAGGFTKHLPIALPLAATIWLYGQSRRSFTTWLGTAVLLAAAAVLACYLLYGTDFITGILQSPREYSYWHLRGKLVWLLPELVLLLAAIIARPAAIFEQRLRLPLTYLLFALAIGIAISGGAGTDRNVFIDVLIACCLIVALCIDSALLAAQSSRLARAATLAAIAMVTLAGTRGLLPVLHADRAALASLDARERVLRADIVRVRELGAATAACDDLTVCYRAGAPFLFDAFNFGQKLWTGARPERACGDTFARGAFAVLILGERDPPRSFRLTEACNASIRQHYRVVYDSGERLFLVYAGAAQDAGQPGR